LETGSDSNLGAGIGRNAAIDDDDDDICIIADCFNMANAAMTLNPKKKLEIAPKNLQNHGQSKIDVGVQTHQICIITVHDKYLENNSSKKKKTYTHDRQPKIQITAELAICFTTEEIRIFSLGT
jgi:hypothetical protein